jgi:hypothetical protein
MKPQLPPLLTFSLSEDVVRMIYSYVPHFRKQRKSKSVCSVSPNMQRDLRRIQSTTLKGKNEMYMRDLEDFVL